MSRITKQIAAVEFQANSRQANAALESIRADADKARRTIAEMEEALAKGITTMKGADGIEFDVAKKLQEATKAARDFDHAAQALIKGAKAFDELWKNAKLGTIEELNAAQIKAGINGGKVRADRLKLGDAEDRKAAAAIQDMIDEGQRVLDKLKLNTQNLIQTFESGGRVAEDVLKREMKTLEDLMHLSQQGSEEWQTYYRQYHTIGDEVERLQKEERKLRGEIVDREDALRVASQADKEATEQAIAAAKERVRIGQEAIKQKREEVELHKTAAEAAQADVDDARRELAAKREESSELHKTTEERREAARQRVKDARDAADAEKRAFDEVKESLKQNLDTANGRVEELKKQLEALGEVKVEPEVDKDGIVSQFRELYEQMNTIRSKMDSSQGIMPVEGLRKELEGMPAKIDALKQKLKDIGISQEAIDRAQKLARDLEDTKRDLQDITKEEQAANESLKQFGITTGDITDEVKLQAAAEKALKIEEESRLELAKEMLAVRKEMGKTEMKGAAIMGSKADRDFYAKNKGILDDEWWKQEAGGGSAHRMYKYLDGIYGDDEMMAEFQEQVGVSVKDAMRIAGQKMREVLQQAMKRGIKIDDAMSDFADGYSHGPAVKIKEFLDEFNEAVSEKENALIKARRKKLADIADVVYEPGDEIDSREQRIELAKSAIKGVATGYGESPLADVAKDLREEVSRLEEEIKQSTQTTQQAADADKERTRLQGEMAKATADQTKAQEEYNNAEKKYLDAEQGVKDAEKEKKEVFAETLQQRRDMGTAVEALETKEQQRVGTLQQEQQAQAKLNDEIDQHATDVMKANQEIDQLQTNSIEKMEQAIKVLDVWNRKTNEPGGKEWVETEERIGSIQQRIDDLKQKSKELRGEVMSLSDALGMAGTIDGGGASVEKMEQAIKTLTEAKRKATDQKDFDEYGAAIDKISQKLKEATSEWMSLSRAEEIARQAGENYYLSDGKSGFVASPEEIQKATQALERQRETLIKTIQAKKANKEATDAEEKELADLTKKLRDLKFEQDNVNMSQAKMRRLMEQPAQAVSLDELRAAIKRADGELRRMEGSLGKNSKEYKTFAEQVKQAKNTLKDMEGAAKASASAWEKAVSRLKTYVGLYMGFNILWQKMVGTIGDLHELSDRMGEVGKTTQMASGEIDLLTDNLKKIDTRTPVTELLSLSAAAGQLGLKSREDVEGFTEAANKMLVALPEMGRDGATQMMKVALATGEVERIRKQMEEGMIEGSSATAVAMEKIASTIDQLRANSAAAAPQITDFVKRVGAVGAQSGITIDQVAALGSTVDALGMRVEMSATALSRMIPAIKNNAFEVAKAIGMAPEALRHMFDEAGGGMNAMLAIFQHIKDSGMNADDIEKMMGMGGMQDIMKDLNQQGARAGIVFAGLSQNVDVLREHLGIAHDAYEENIAIQQEYDRMNETTAAKWERLANKVEEMFVGSGTQSALGKIYDMLTWIVDLITGPLNTAFLSATGAVLAIKSGLTEIPSAVGNVFDYLKDSAAKASEALEKAANATSEISEAAEGVEEAGDAVGEISDALGDAKEAGEQAGEAMESATGAIEGMTGATKVSIFSVKGLKAAWKGLDTTMKANIIVAVIALLYTLGKAIYNVVTEIGKNNKAVAEANAMIQVAIDRFEGYWQKLKDTATALDQAREKTKKLKEGSEELTKATVDVTKADNAHRAAIADMNSIYGKYLGFMLTEQNYALLNAAAHDKVTAAIRREMLAKQQQAAIDQVTQENTENLKTGLANLTEELREDGRLNTEQSAQAKRAVQQFMRENIKFSAGGDATISNEAYKYLQSKGANRGKLKGLSVDEFAAAWFYEYLEDNFHLDKASLADITGVFPQGGGYRNTNKLGRNFRGDYASAYSNYMQEIVETQDVFAGETADAEKKDRDATQKLVKKLQQDAKNAQAKILNKGASQQERNQAYEQLANALEGLDTNIDQLNPVSDKTLIEGAKQLADNIAKTVDSGKLTRARSNARSIFARATNGSNVETQLESLDPEKNIWGDRLPAESTDWKNMTAEQLVNRRKQMADFVNSIQTDTDVKAVLEEDKALMKAFKGRQATMREVVEWYNQQRLLIQDELHARHLTNTGDWMDPKKERGAKKQFRDEMDAYLHELDAYYTERKTRIEQARNDEEITEGEAWRRTIQNDNEWQTRRAELQKLYSRKQQEVTKEELDAILRIISERTGDSEAFVKAAIAKTNQFVDAIEKSGDKGAAIVHRWMSQVVLDTERSYLKAAQTIGKQMKFIEDTLAKERPYDGITKNLQDNLDKMGVLAAKYRRENEELARQNKEPKYSNEQITAQSYDEMAFYLRQAADAYSIDIDELLRRMVKEGMTATAEEISKSDMLKQAVMGQLRKTYQEVQDAVKKEASQIKKDVEIIWNDDARGIGGMSMKATFDKALAQLGMQQDSVSRANSLIGAGAASDNVASRLAMKQIEVQMRMQKAQYDMYRVQANQRMAALKAEAKEHQRIAELEKQAGHEAAAAEQRTKAMVALRDAENVRLSLGLTLAEETKKEEQQKAELLKIQEESQNRLYTSLREWADLLTSSIQGVFEASHAGDAEYYNERAKLDLTGKGGPGAGTYVVIDNAGTSDATAHYEYLDERQALERQHEIEQQNAQAEAWRKLMDDFNQKMADSITDWANAYMQNKATEDNTAELQKLQGKLGEGEATLNMSIAAENRNTDALNTLTSKLSEGINVKMTPDDTGGSEFAADKANGYPSAPSKESTSGPDFASDKQMNYPSGDQANTDATIANTQALNAMTQAMGGQVPESADITGDFASDKQANYPSGGGEISPAAQQKIDDQNAVTDNAIKNKQKEVTTSTQGDKKIAQSNQSTFAKMIQATNLYGVAYAAMSNDNMDMAQKFEMIALQAVGNAAIAGLQVALSQSTAQTAANMPAAASRASAEEGPIAGPILFAVLSALVGGLMGIAASKIAKSKSQIAQVTGASVGAGRLATGMLTYAEGNVNEFTDPASLTPGRQYNVDGADGKTYRARYMGKDAKTHITNGPEFHLVGEKGREAIIDAHTTRLMQTDDTGIWQAIQTLYNGGRVSGFSTRRGRGVRAFAEGNLDDFEDAMGGEDIATDSGGGGMSMEQMLSFQQSLDANTAIMQRLADEGIEAFVSPYGKRGIVNGYDHYKKEAQRQGVKY